MTCEPAKSLIESYLDDELDATLSAQMREHLATCDACAATHAQYLELRRGIRSNAPYYNAPAYLAGRIRDGLRQAARSESRPWRWLAVAASILLAVSLGWNVWLLRPRTSGPDLIAQEVLSSHVRSLMGTHLLDVPSSDQHTVKPWFNGKLDFSPDVRDFDTQGFPLIGGRADYVDGHAAAGLVYRRWQHIINLFTWPSASPGGGTEFARNGYYAVHWSQGGMTYWAVSDLRLSELRQFAALYQQ